VVIDRRARDRLAEQLRHLAGGRITNDEFEDSLPGSHDRAVREVERAAWMLYSDLREHRLTGSDALPREVRRAIARSIVFLHSDLEYEWPPHPCVGFRRVVGTVLSFGLIPKYFDRRYKASGEFEAWPFIRSADLERAAQMPRLLAQQS
jgi:hypothetical protein